MPVFKELKAIKPKKWKRERLLKAIREDRLLVDFPEYGIYGKPFPEKLGLRGPRV